MFVKDLFLIICKGNLARDTEICLRNPMFTTVLDDQRIHTFRSMVNTRAPFKGEHVFRNKVDIVY